MRQVIPEKVYREINSDKFNFLDENPHLGNNLSLLCISGSYSYGLETDHSDIDMRGFAIPSPTDYFQMKDFEQIEKKDPDVTIYSSNKFINLLKKGNPNIIEVFDAAIVYADNVWNFIFDNKDAFISNRAISAFKGFYKQQIYRLQHYQSNSNIEAACLRIGKYQSNVIRCMRMGAELFLTGEVHTYREHDREELLEIKNGKWAVPDKEGKVVSTEDFFNCVANEEKKFNYAVDHSVLPEEPDDKYIEEIQTLIAEHVLKKYFRSYYDFI